jgi:hypothetical protein
MLIKPKYKRLAAIGSIGAIAAALGLGQASCGGDEATGSSGNTGSGGGGGGSGPCEPGATQPCYTGPIVSEGVGVCKGGVRTCNPAGTAFGVCEGEVTPVFDDCATPEDEDCDGTPASACAGSHLASKAFGSAADEGAESVAFDASGNMIIAGSFSGVQDMPGTGFGGAPLKSGGARDVFVAKLDPQGAHLYSRGFGDDVNQVASSVAVDASGSALVTGWFEGILNASPGKIVASLGGRDVFILKLDASGEPAWVRSFGGAGASQEGAAVAVTASGDVVVTGSFDESLAAGQGPSLTSEGGLDIFVAKLSSATGDVSWFKRFGGAGDQAARGIAVDSAGRVIVTGALEGSMAVGATTLMSAGGEDVFVLTLDSAGEPVASARYGDSLDQAGKAVAATSMDGVLVAGSFQGKLDVGGTPLESAGSDDIFVVKLSSAGAPEWAKQFGDPGTQQILSLAADASGGVVLTGKFDGSLNFGKTPPLPGTEAFDVFVAKLDPAGAYVWARAFGGKFDQVGLGVALSKAGEVALTGTFFGSVNLGGELLKSAGLSDIFLARFAP